LRQGRSRLRWSRLRWSRLRWSRLRWSRLRWSRLRWSRLRAFRLSLSRLRACQQCRLRLVNRLWARRQQCYRSSYRPLLRRRRSVTHRLRLRFRPSGCHRSSSRRRS
jgi:ribosomal protein L44E